MKRARLGNRSTRTALPNAMHVTSMFTQLSAAPRISFCNASRTTNHVHRQVHILNKGARAGLARRLLTAPSPRCPRTNRSNWSSSRRTLRPPSHSKSRKKCSRPSNGALRLAGGCRRVQIIKFDVEVRGQGPPLPLVAILSDTQ